MAAKNETKGDNSAIPIADALSDVDQIDVRLTPLYFPDSPPEMTYADTRRLSCYYTITMPVQGRVGALRAILLKSIRPGTDNIGHNSATRIAVTDINANIKLVITHRGSPPSSLLLEWSGTAGGYGAFGDKVIAASPEFVGELRQWIFTNAKVDSSAGDAAQGC